VTEYRDHTHQEFSANWHEEDQKLHLNVTTWKTRSSIGPSGRTRVIDESRDFAKDVLVLSLDDAVRLASSLQEGLGYFTRLVTAAGVRVDPRTEKVILPENEPKD
jgi:hypothetical protein